jgi:hypothetical protein
MNFANLTITNWKTTVMGLLPLACYGLKWAGVWPESIPLPPIEKVWPEVLALIGLGWMAKDADVTGGTRQQ